MRQFATSRITWYLLLLPFEMCLFVSSWFIEDRKSRSCSSWILLPLYKLPPSLHFKKHEWQPVYTQWGITYTLKRELGNIRSICEFNSTRKTHRIFRYLLRGVTAQAPNHVWKEKERWKGQAAGFTLNKDPMGATDLAIFQGELELICKN